VKKILFTVMACVLCLGLIGSAFAYFSDTETSSGNTFTAAILDLELCPGNPIPFGLSNIAPGQSGTGKVTLTDTASSLDGELDIRLANFVQYENDRTEPELHPGWGTADYPAGPNAGELNFFLGFAAYVDVNQNGVFDTGDVQLTYNGQQHVYPGFWAGDFHYHPMSSMLIGWDDIITMTAGQSVDLVIMWLFPGPQAVGDGNYSHNIAMTDGMTFDVLTSLEQVGGNGGVTN
jgi:predicted ribosomally synthesized peptide with SipW-like signal peptide